MDLAVCLTPKRELGQNWERIEEGTGKEFIELVYEETGNGIRRKKPGRNQAETVIDEGNERNLE